MTQKDIRDLQLAKAAVRAGIDILRNRFDRPVEKIYITGLFGARINKESANDIGIFPEDVDPGIVEVVESAALSGLAELMAAPDMDAEIASISRKIEHVELAKSKDFESIFTGAMSF